MTRSAVDQKLKLPKSRDAALVLMAPDSDISTIIRRRLADVADELRQVAGSAGSASENLLQIANRFEQHAKAGDTPWSSRS
jgi:hypothetical protein